MYPIKHVSVKTLFVYWKIIWDHVVRHNLLTVSEFKIITHMGKHMQDCIISPRGRRPYHFTKGKATVSVHQGEGYRIITPREGYRIISPRGRLPYHFTKGKANAYKTSFTLPHLIEVRSCIHIRGIYFASFYDFAKTSLNPPLFIEVSVPSQEVGDHVYYLWATFHDFGFWKCSDSVEFFLFFLVLDFSTSVSLSTNSHLCQYHLYCMKELYYRK